MERDLEKFRQASAEHIKFYRKIERINGVIAGILIGTGVGGWVAMGMKPIHAIPLILFGASFGFGGYGDLLRRRHYEEYRNDVLKREDPNYSPKG